MYTKFLSIDIHTSGPSPLQHTLFAIGAVLFDKDGVILSEFKSYIKNNNINWYPSTKNFWLSEDNKENFEIMINNSKDANYVDCVIKNFYNWIQDLNELYKDDIVLITDTVLFDLNFIDYYLNKFGYPSVNYIFGDYRPTFDTTSYHRGVAGLSPYEDGLWGAEVAACKKLGIMDIYKSNPYNNSNHDPLDDAKSTGWIHTQILKAVKTF
jgi:hypothetical protein